MKEQFITWFEQLSLLEQRSILVTLKEKNSKKFRATFAIVEIYNRHGNISHIIEKETGFECYHIPGEYAGTIGTNKILVPREKYTAEFEAELRAKWDNYIKS